MPDSTVASPPACASLLISKHDVQDLHHIDATTPSLQPNKEPLVVKIVDTKQRTPFSCSEEKCPESEIAQLCGNPSSSATSSSRAHTSSTEDSSTALLGLNLDNKDHGVVATSSSLLVAASDESSRSTNDDAAGAVTAEYLRQTDTTAIERGEEKLHAAHQNFVSRLLPNTELNMGEFGRWLQSFRDSPQTIQTIIQSYAAVLIARENRAAKMHENFCGLLSKRSDATSVWHGIREKCRAEVVKEFVRERFQTQRCMTETWAVLVQKHQEQITKRVEQMEITKRLMHERGWTKRQAVWTVIGVLGASFCGLFRVHKYSGGLTAVAFDRKRLFLACLGYLIWTYKNMVEKMRMFLIEGILFRRNGSNFLSYDLQSCEASLVRPGNEQATSTTQSFAGAFSSMSSKDDCNADDFFSEWGQTVLGRMKKAMQNTRSLA